MMKTVRETSVRVCEVPMRLLGMAKRGTPETVGTDSDAKTARRAPGTLDYGTSVKTIEIVVAAVNYGLLSDSDLPAAVISIIGATSSGKSSLGQGLVHERVSPSAERVCTLFPTIMHCIPGMEGFSLTLPGQPTIKLKMAKEVEDMISALREGMGENPDPDFTRPIKLVMPKHSENHIPNFILSDTPGVILSADQEKTKLEWVRSFTFPDGMKSAIALVVADASICAPGGDLASVMLCQAIQDEAKKAKETGWKGPLVLGNIKIVVVFTHIDKVKDPSDFLKGIDKINKLNPVAVAFAQTDGQPEHENSKALMRLAKARNPNYLFGVVELLNELVKLYSSNFDGKFLLTLRQTMEKRQIALEQDASARCISPAALLRPITHKLEQNWLSLIDCEGLFRTKTEEIVNAAMKGRSVPVPSTCPGILQLTCSFFMSIPSHYFPKKDAEESARLVEDALDALFLHAYELVSVICDKYMVFAKEVFKCHDKDPRIVEILDACANSAFSYEKKSEIAAMTRRDIASFKTMSDVRDPYLVPPPNQKAVSFWSAGSFFAVNAKNPVVYHAGLVLHSTIRVLVFNTLARFKERCANALHVKISAVLSKSDCLPETSAEELDAISKEREWLAESIRFITSLAPK